MLLHTLYLFFGVEKRFEKQGKTERKLSFCHPELSPPKKRIRNLKMTDCGPSSSDLSGLSAIIKQKTKKAAKSNLTKSVYQIS